MSNIGMVLSNVVKKAVKAALNMASDAKFPDPTLRTPGNYGCTFLNRIVLTFTVGFCSEVLDH
jgi:hypothetical protein